MSNSSIDLTPYFTDEEIKKLSEMPPLSKEEEEKLRKIARFVVIQVRDAMKNGNIKL